MTGRPTKFTRELGRACVALAAEGKSRYAVAGLIGVSPQTLGNWLDGVAESISDEDHDAFLSAYAKAEAEVESRHADVLAEDPDWRARLVILERRHKHWRMPKDESDTANQNTAPQVIVVQVPAQQPTAETP